MGYLTLYVIKRTLPHENDDPRTAIIVLQHADVYDEHTRTTTTYLRSCFPTADIHNHTFPKEHASDFTLLAALAATARFPNYEVPDEILAELFARA